jgi:hypothetical protein
MIETRSVDACLSFISSQLQSTGETAAHAENRVRRAVTLSRQTGCGALVVAEKLAEYLQQHSKHAPVWTVFDRNLMDKVLEDHNLPAYLARFLPEDPSRSWRISWMKCLRCILRRAPSSTKPPRRCLNWPLWAM